MNLTFNQDANGRFIAEFEITDKAALHIERARNASMYLYQKSSPNEDYAFVKDGDTRAAVFDTDLTALVYPKYIKIISYEEPTLATLTSDGEVTEIVAQSKSVEVTANGSVTITPDSGYGYLSDVVVTTNVPQEGGGGTIDAKYLGLGVVNINEGWTGCYAYPSEYATWEEVINNLNYPCFLISNGYVNFMEDSLNSCPLYYDADLTQRVSETDEPLSQDYYIEGVSGGGSSGN